MISTSFMSGTGFMKCIPITWVGRDTAPASLVMEIDEVFEARMASFLHARVGCAQDARA